MGLRRGPLGHNPSRLKTLPHPCLQLAGCWGRETGCTHHRKGRGEPRPRGGADEAGKQDTGVAVRTGRQMGGPLADLLQCPLQGACGDDALGAGCQDALKARDEELLHQSMAGNQDAALQCSWLEPGRKRRMQAPTSWNLPQPLRLEQLHSKGAASSLGRCKGHPATLRMHAETPGRGHVDSRPASPRTQQSASAACRRRRGGGGWPGTSEHSPRSCCQVEATHHRQRAQGGRRCEALLERVHLLAQRLLRALAQEQGQPQPPDVFIPPSEGALQGLDLAHQPGCTPHLLVVSCKAAIGRACT